MQRPGNPPTECAVPPDLVRMRIALHRLYEAAIRCAGRTEQSNENRPDAGELGAVIEGEEAHRDECSRPQFLHE